METEALRQGRIPERRPDADAKAPGLLAVARIGAVATRCRLGPGGIRGDQRIVRVIEEVIERRVGSLLLPDLAVELAAMPQDPINRRHALLDETAERLIRHHVADLDLEVLVHLLRRIVLARFLLDPGAAAGIVDAAVGRRGTAALVTIDRDHAQAPLQPLERRRDSGAAQPDHHQVGSLVPRDGVRVGDDQRVLDRNPDLRGFGCAVFHGPPGLSDDPTRN